MSVATIEKDAPAVVRNHPSMISHRVHPSIRAVFFSTINSGPLLCAARAKSAMSDREEDTTKREEAAEGEAPKAEER